MLSAVFLERDDLIVTQHSRDTPHLHLTAPSPCPYLPGRHERKVFTHLVGEKAGDLNDLLTHGGFRRSQSIAYRPAWRRQCRACCVSVRVVAGEFRASRNFRKIMARNADVIGEQRSAVPTSEQYSVFRAYLDQRHRHGGMADMTVLDYAGDGGGQPRRDPHHRNTAAATPTAASPGRGSDLLAVALTDVLSDGLSMVYSFFEPSEESRSLGTLQGSSTHITRARRLGLPRGLSRLLDRGLEEDGLQGPLPAAAGELALPPAGSASTRPGDVGSEPQE